MTVGLYTSRVVLATLGADDFGLNAVVTSAVTIFYFLNSSMAGATSRFLTFELGKGDREKLKKTFSAALTIHIIIALIVLVLGETVGLWYLENKMVIPEGRMTAARWVYQLSLISAMFTLTQVPYNASIIAHERMNIYAYIEILQTCLRLGIVFLLVTGDFDKLILYALLTLCVTLMITVIYRIYCVKQFVECRYKFHKDKSIIYPMLSFSGWDLFGNLGLTVKANGLSLVLNLFYSTVVNTAYGLADQVSRGMAQLAANLTIASKPQIIKYYTEKNFIQLQTLVNNSTLYMCLLFFTMSFPILLEVDFILDLWLIKVPEYTGIFIQLLLFAVFSSIVQGGLNASIHATGKIKTVSWKTSMVNFLVPVSAYFICRLINVPAYTCLFLNLLAAILNTIIKLVTVKRIIPQFSLRLYFRKVILTVLTVVVPASVFPLIIRFSIEESFTRLMFLTLTNLFCTAALTYSIVLNENTRIQIKTVLINKFSR
ncbi:MAG: hypothetical protein LBP25_06625 [Tannerellaceae bacterium]|jgi:hypothetical protein|nr:hypothetical protein [Tannerellaceae bacterium]